MDKLKMAGAVCLALGLLAMVLMLTWEPTSTVTPLEVTLQIAARGLAGVLLALVGFSLLVLSRHRKSVQNRDQIARLIQSRGVGAERALYPGRKQESRKVGSGS